MTVRSSPLCGIGDLDNGFPLLTFRRTRSDVGLAVSRRTRSLRVRSDTGRARDAPRSQHYAGRVRSQRGAGAIRRTSQ